MKLPAYLQRNRYGVFYYRKAIPCDLRGWVGKREFILSLRTSDRHIAIHQSRLYALYIEDIISSLRRLVAKKKNKGLTVRYEYNLDLETGTELFKPSQEDIEQLKLAGLSPEQISAHLLSMRKEMADDAHGRSRPSEKNTNTPSTNKPALSLSEFVALFQKDWIESKGGKRQLPSKLKTIARRLLEITGDIALPDLTREHARHIRTTLMKLPSNSAKYKNQSINIVLKETHSNTLSVKTISDHIEHYKGMLDWAIQENLYSKANPFNGISPKDPVAKNEKRDPFTQAELKTIFSHEIFTSFDSVKYKPHQYWAPLIALFTGARNAEIGAIELDDFSKVECTETNMSFWTLSIIKDGKNRVLKTSNAVRTIPLHNQLIELGLIDYITQQKKSSEKRLFHYLKWENNSKYGRYIGEHFNNTLKTIGIHQHIRKTFYSFRHTIATELERKGISDARIEQLSGRASSEKKTTGRQHYITTPDAIALYQDIMKLNFSECLVSAKPFLCLQE